MRDDRRGSPRWNGSNGVHPDGMRTRPVPVEDHTDPIDLVSVQADDELINALSAGMTVSAPGVGGYDADDRVAAILAAWKAEVDAEPIPELIDVDTAVATVMAARPRSSRMRHLAPVAAAAAFVVLAVGGVSVGSYSAQPDDALWGVSKVLYSERAESVEAAARVETRIANAKEALVAGQPVVAAQELEQAQADLVAVRPEEGLTELVDVQTFLVAKAAETPQGTPTDPGAPLATQPARRVPAGAAVSSPAQQQPPGSDPSIDTPLTPAPVPAPDPGTAPEPVTPPAEPAPEPTEAPTTSPPPTQPAPDETPAGEPPTATAEGSAATTTGLGQTPPAADAGAGGTTS